ncbi:hypothetical protein [Bradyrhizobium sp. RP6]|uniref:hypothetical protein n=1 Tax=Bradyrhizobium sp. RP6 TaxID=2489596 RepID=UPI000F52453F|nr:hypothetical protein [Bradyrhizobium sp. RP6]RQH09471.1 hypothetical protein EHH60_25470 [Bradyrhizobium sp. RP6]
MDFIAFFLRVKGAISKRLARYTLDIPGALRTGFVRGCIVVALTGALFISSTLLRDDSELKPGRMPQCDSTFARDLLTKVVNESIAGQRGIRLLQVDEVADFAVRAPATSGEPQADARNCSAFVRTNAGKAILFFQLTWSSSKKDEVWLEITQSSL